MSIVGLVSLSVLTLPLAMADAPWGTSQTISTGTLSDSPHMVMSADGQTVIVVWKTGTSILARRSTDGGQTWDTAQTLASDAQSVTEPQIASSADATAATVVWERNDNTLRSSRTSDAAATWDAAVAMTADNTVAPRIASSADGMRITATWWRILGGVDPTIFAQTSGDGGQTWGPVNALSAVGGDATYPQVVSSADGNLITVAWSPFLGGEVRAATSTDAGDSWETSKAVNATGGRLTDLTAADDGTAAAAWQQFNGSRDAAFVATRAAGQTTWSSPVAVSTDRSGLNAQVASLRVGTRLAAAWKTDDSRLQVSTSADGGQSWAVPKDLTLSLGDGFELASSRAGQRLVAVWLGPSGSVLASTSPDAGATWTPAATVDPGAGTPFYPKVVSASDGGTAGAVWHRVVSGVYTVQYAPASIPVSLFSAAPVDFGQQVAGAAQSRVLTVTNAGSGPLDIEAVAVTGAGFSIEGQTCSSGLVIPGGTCAVNVSFSAASVGSRTGTVHFVDNSDVGFDEVGLTAEAVAPGPTLSPSPSDSPTPTVSASGVGPSPSVTQEPRTTRLTVKARKVGSIPATKKTVLIRSVNTNGRARVVVKCSRKNACGTKAAAGRVSVKPACRQGLRVTVAISATSPGAQPGSWSRTWKVKACRAR